MGRGMRTTVLSVTTSGTDGSATGSATTTRVLSGALVAAHMNYSDNQPATTDVTLKEEASGDAPETTLLTVSNTATDGWYYVREQVVDNTASSVDGVYSARAIDSHVTASVTGGDDGETVKVTLRWVDG